MASLSFQQVGVFGGLPGNSQSNLSNPTSLQFGPDGRLYVSEQNGSINAFTIALQGEEYVATSHELLKDANGNEVVKSIQNHNDQGGAVNVANRQVTGIVVTGTAVNPVLYISSSDPLIAQNGEKNLDTNSGVVTRATWNGNAWVVVDLVRGLPRSEENHAVNGMLLSEDGTKLLLQVGGNTNNGAPSSFFSYTGEYVLSGSILELDLLALDALPIKNDSQAGQGGTSRAYIYDLPTLDDPNVPNVTDGVGEDVNGMDEDGPWGGNDGLNMAILPADAPLRLYADGLRNPYDLARTPNGNIYTVDNGSNANLGNAPLREGVNGDLDNDGIKNEALNNPNNGGYGEGEPLFLIEEGGFYGHANPVRSNQNMSWTVYNDNGIPDASVGVNSVPNIADRVPAAVNIADGYLIDPSKFAAGPNQSLADLTESQRTARLLLSGLGGDRDLSDVPIALVGSSTNGIVSYDSGGAAFNGILDGKLFVTQFNDNITLLNINDAGTGLDPVSLESGPDGIFGTADDVLKTGGKSGIQEVANNLLGVPLANPLDVAVGPNGTLWVAEIGGNEITVLAPSTLDIIVETDVDDDGIDNKFDPFQRDATNGTAVVINPGQPTVWEFSQDAASVTPGPDGFGGGVTGVMINGTTDFEQFLQSPSPRLGDIIQLDNVKFVTAAGGGTTTIEEVTSGDPGQGSNSGEFLFHTGFKLANNVDTFTVKWVVANPGAISGGSDITTNFQQIGGYLGDGTQSNFLKIVAVATNSNATQASIQVQLENNDQIVQTINLPANNIFNNQTLVPESSISFELLIDPGAKTATPKATFNTTSGPVTITGNQNQVINLTNSTVLQTILGNKKVQGKTTGIAAGLFALNTRPQGEGQQPSTDSFQAVFDSITVTATANSASERVVLYRVNAGGPEVAALATDPVQMAWAGNAGIQIPPGVSLNTGKSSAPSIATQGRDVSLPDYVPYQVFNSERWDAGALPEMEWNFAVTPGATYEVNLFLRDGFSGTSTAGQRIFDVEIEGIEYHSGVDLSATYGSAVGAMLSQQLTVADDSLDIKFLHQVQNPLINAIEIIQLSDGPTAPPPVVNIVFGDQTVNENEGTANISILSSKTVPANQTIDILFKIEPLGTATAGPNGDYQYVSSTATFGGGVYTDTKSIAGSSSDLQIPIQINNDNVVEGAESFKFTIISVSPNAVLGNNSDAIITIADDDSPASSLLVEAESSTNVTNYRLETNSVASGGSMLSFAGAPAQESGSASYQFAGPTGTYTVVLGTFDENDGEATLTLSKNGVVAGSVILDENKPSNAAISTTKVERVVATGLSLTSGDVITVTGIENGSEHARFDYIRYIAATTANKTVSLAATTQASEPSSNGQFTVSLSQPSSTSTTVSYSVSGSATPGSPGTAGADYTALSGSVIIPANQTSAAINVQVLDDTNTEGTESVVVNLTGISGGTGVVLGTNTQATVNIADNDQPVSSLLVEAENADTITNYRLETNSVASGGSMLSFAGAPAQESGSASYQFAGPTGTYTVALGTFDENDGEATLTLSKNGVVAGSVILDENKPSNAANSTTKVERVVATGLSLASGDVITVTGIENGSEHARFDYIRYIPATTTNKTVSLAATTQASEPSSNGQFTVSLSQPSSTSTTVSYSVSGSATPGSPGTAGADYTALSGSVVIPANQTSAAINVQVLDDSITEGAESVVVNLTGISGGTGVVLGANTQAAVNIADNDSPVSSLLIEAENADIITNYRIQSVSAASGQQVLGFQGGSANESGSATFIFEGAAGNYDVNIGAFDENDGVSSFTASLKDFETGATTVFSPSILLDQDLGSPNPVNATKVTRKIASNVSLTPGDQITITGVENSTEHARLDTIEFSPLSVSPSNVLYRVNAAGPTISALSSDPVQIAWAANPGSNASILTPPGVSLNTGKVSSTSIAAQGKDISLPDYVPYEVFGTERWDAGALPEMEWNFAVSAGGSYQVNLFLRDGFLGTSLPGQRIFDINIEGVEYFSDIDLSNDYGANVAGMLSQQLVVNDGSLDIEFLHQVQNPIINAIEIIQLSSSSGANLLLDASPAIGGEILTQNQLEPVTLASVDYWREQGVSADGIQQLLQTPVFIKNLDQGTIGTTEHGSIYIDDDAAGHGWSTSLDVVAAGKVDLLSTVVHEHGHVLGYDHEVLGHDIGLGERNLPNESLFYGSYGPSLLPDNSPVPSELLISGENDLRPLDISQTNSLPSADSVSDAGDLFLEPSYLYGTDNASHSPTEPLVADSTPSQDGSDLITGLDTTTSLPIASTTTDYLSDNLSSTTDSITGVFHSSAIPSATTATSTWPSSAASTKLGVLEPIVFPTTAIDPMLPPAKLAKEPNATNSSLLVADDPLNPYLPMAI